MVSRGYRSITNHTFLLLFLSLSYTHSFSFLPIRLKANVCLTQKCGPEACRGQIEVRSASLCGFQILKQCGGLRIALHWHDWLKVCGSGRSCINTISLPWQLPSQQVYSTALHCSSKPRSINGLTFAEAEALYMLHGHCRRGLDQVEPFIIEHLDWVKHHALRTSIYTKLMHFL